MTIHTVHTNSINSLQASFKRVEQILWNRERKLWGGDGQALVGKRNKDELSPGFLGDRDAEWENRSANPTVLALISMYQNEYVPESVPENNGADQWFG